MKRCLLDKASVVLQLYAEQREIQASEVVVVDAAVPNLADVLLDRKFRRLHRQRSQTVARYGVVRHARVNVVLDLGLLRRA
jgi:hypothetical protein